MVAFCKSKQQTQAALALSQGVWTGCLGEGKWNTLRLQILHETPLCPRQPQTLRNGVLGWWETLKTNVTACRATLRNGSYHNNFDSQLYIICIDYCISLVNRFSWSGHWRAIQSRLYLQWGYRKHLGKIFSLVDFSVCSLTDAFVFAGAFLSPLTYFQVWSCPVSLLRKIMPLCSPPE